MKPYDKQKKLWFKIGAICAFGAFLVMLTEILLTALPDGARVEHGIEALYQLYERNWFMAMRFMGLMNIFATSLTLLTTYALFCAYREKLPFFAGFALLITIISYAIFISDNVAFPFLELAQKFTEASSDTQRFQLLAAGEALYARGASHTAGTFPGFFISQLAGILFSVIILKGKILKKAIGIIGLVAFVFLLIFEIISSFISHWYNEAIIFAMIGGISALVWYIMLALDLYKLSKP